MDARLSRDIDDIASASPRKLFLLLRYCLRAIWLRISRGATHFYYVPAPGLRNAVYRDWIVMLVLPAILSEDNLSLSGGWRGWVVGD